MCDPFGVVAMWMSCPRRSRPAVLSPLRYESGKAERSIVRPLWGRTAGPLVPRPYVLTTKKDETFLGLISFVIPAGLTSSIPAPATG